MLLSQSLVPIAPSPVLVSRKRQSDHPPFSGARYIIYLCLEVITDSDIHTYMASDIHTYMARYKEKDGSHQSWVSGITWIRIQGIMEVG